MGWFVGIAIAFLLSVVGPQAAHAQDAPAKADFRLDTLHVYVGSRLGSGAGAVQIIDREELMALPVQGVGEALRWMAGVDL